MVKILDIGSGVASVASVVFDDIQDKQIVRADVNPDLKPDVIFDITKPLPEELKGQFDIVYCSHMMEHIDRNKVFAAMDNLIAAAKDMGEIWVIVPSMEWAANEILRGRDGIHIQGHIFGGQSNEWEYHRSGFTLSALRFLFESRKILVRKAYQAPFTLGYENREFQCVQNVEIGLKYV